MAMKYDNGRIALWRKFLDWEWYTDVNTKAVFLHLLLTANWKDKKWKGMLIKRGQLWTSYSGIAKETGLSIQSVRTAIKHLESTGEITKMSTHKGMLVNVENYDSYQAPLCESNTQGNQQANTAVTKSQQQLNKENKDNNIYCSENVRACKEIVAYLNQRVGKNFKSNTKGTQRLINARLNEGYTVSDFKRVIDMKAAQWQGTEMDKYLQPSTLFGTKFEGYVNEKPLQDKREPLGFKELN